MQGPVPGLEQRIRGAMARQGVPSILELARLSDVGRDTLYGWFRGQQHPSPEAATRVADVLGMTSVELFGDVDTITSPTLVELAERQVALLERIAVAEERTADYALEIAGILTRTVGLTPAEIAALRAASVGPRPASGATPSARPQRPGPRRIDR